MKFWRRWRPAKPTIPKVSHPKELPEELCYTCRFHTHVTPPCNGRVFRLPTPAVVTCRLFPINASKDYNDWCGQYEPEVQVREAVKSRPVYAREGTSHSS